MNHDAPFVFRCNAGDCVCHRRCEVTVREGEIYVEVEDEGAVYVTVKAPAELGAELDEGLLRISDGTSVEVTQPTGKRLRSWLGKRGVSVP